MSISKWCSTLIISFICISLTSAQESFAEPSEIGIQIGNQGIWGHYERALSDDVTLRTEVGFDLAIRESTFFDRGGFEALPVLRLEPRWYYNLKRRAGAGKSIKGNVGSFAALQISWRPGARIGYHNILREDVKGFSITPMWGLRKLLNDRWTFEGGVGVRYFREQQDNAIFDGGVFSGVGERQVDEGIAPYWHLRVGYRF